MAGKTKYTYEYVKNEFEKRGYVLISSKYLNIKSKLMFICKNHESKGIQEITFDHFLNRNQGCKYCKHDKTRKEIAIKLINSKGYKITNVTHLDSKTRVDFICDKHKDKGIQNISLHSLQNGHGCKYCGYEQVSLHPHPSRTKNEDVIEFFNNFENINYLGSYFHNGRLRVKYECILHKKDEPLELDYNNAVRQKYLCKDCRDEAHRKQTFNEEIYRLNNNIEILNDYITEDTIMHCKCKIHNNEWDVMAASLLIHPTCPKCRSSISLSELKLSDVLDRFNFRYEKQKRYSNCRDIQKLPFDYYLTDFNILIEFDGEDHYYPIQRGKQTIEESILIFKDKKKKDIIKTEFCKSNNIPLIRIPYWERDNMEYFLFDQLVKYEAIEEIKVA